MTCLCLTRNRRHWLPKAISCFLTQTYPATELLILADGEDVRDLIPNDDRIRLIHLTEAAEIGDKRNFGCERAAGEYIAHFDDDDHSEPGRLTDQMERLLASGKSVTGYHSMKFHQNGTQWWQYEGETHYSLGTSLVYSKAWWAANRFPSLQVGEDNAFTAHAWSSGALVTADAGELMHATIHATNTSPRCISADNWKLL